MPRRGIALVLFLLLGVVVVLLALTPKYAVGENICVRMPFAADGNEQVVKGRYRVTSKAVPSVFEKLIAFSNDGGHYGVVPINADGLETGGWLQAPAGPLESNSNALSQTSDTCP